MVFQKLCNSLIYLNELLLILPTSYYLYIILCLFLIILTLVFQWKTEYILFLCSFLICLFCFFLLFEEINNLKQKIFELEMQKDTGNSALLTQSQNYYIPITKVVLILSAVTIGLVIVFKGVLGRGGDGSCPIPPQFPDMPEGGNDSSSLVLSLFESTPTLSNTVIPLTTNTNLLETYSPVASIVTVGLNVLNHVSPQRGLPETGSLPSEHLSFIDSPIIQQDVVNDEIISPRSGNISNIINDETISPLTEGSSNILNEETLSPFTEGEDFSLSEELILEEMRSVNSDISSFDISAAVDSLFNF